MHNDLPCTVFDEIIKLFLTKMRTDNVLYECVGQYSWIKDVIIKYNELGFLTWASQPGSKGEYDEHKSRKQRALIRGFMPPEMANYVQKTLFDENIVVRTSRNNIELEDKCKVGSVTFTDDIPDINYIGDDIDWKYKASFNLSDPPYREYEWLKTFCENLVEIDIVDVQIFDIRWNDNSTLWSTLLDALIKYNQP